MAENRQSTFEQTKTTDPNSRQPTDENILKSGGVDNQKASRPSSVHKGDTLHWFAYVGPDQKEVRSESTEDREQRLKILRDKQNEERQRKLEELKAQALAAQRFRELKEEERRRRIEDLRVRETDRRQQVGERKRLIYEAERDRRESILKKNMEREARFELKKRNERSALNFAFGSSTPRMLEPGDTVGSFWGHRRATSTNNIVFSAVPLTRRSSERDLDGSKKRATSAGGLDRNITEGNGETIPAGCASGHVGRRRTDLMPTIPTRDTACASLRKAFTKSPGRAYSMSRLDQLAKPRKRVPADLPSVQESDSPKSHPQPSPSNKSMSRSMGHLAVSRLAVPSPQRPLRKSDSKSMHQLSVAPPMPPPRTTRAILLRKRAMELPAGPSRPGSSLSQQSTTSVASSINMRQKPAAAPRKPRPISIAETGVTSEQNKNIAMSDAAKKPDVSKPPLPKTRKSSLVKVSEKTPTKSMKASPKVSVKTTPLQSPCSDAPMSVVDIQPAQQQVELKPIDIEESKQPYNPVQQNQAESVVEPVLEPTANISLTKDEPEKSSETITEQPPNQSIEEPNLDMVDMTASMIAKVRITTEEEAKAALAEKRRRAREEAERAAEAERLRIEEETRLEQERQRKEEEQLRKLAEDQRRAEEERLAQAIKEAQKREEEERLKREEEQKLKLEKEEQERKAREESEKQRLEMQERLKQEEIEREARRKRVEAIMLRTRAKNNGTNQNKDEGANEKNIEEMKSSEINNKSTIELYEKTAMEKEAILFNGAFKNQTVNSQENGDSHKDPQHNNGHRNGVEISDNFSKVDNSLIQHVTNTLLDISELDPFKNDNTSLDLSTDKINNEDNINSNNPTESCGTTDLLL